MRFLRRCASACHVFASNMASEIPLTLVTGANSSCVVVGGMLIQEQNVTEIRVCAVQLRSSVVACMVAKVRAI